MTPVSPPGFGQKINDFWSHHPVLGRERNRTPEYQSTSESY